LRHLVRDPRRLQRMRLRGGAERLDRHDALVAKGGNPEVSLVGGAPRIEGPQLEGHAPKASLQAFLPNREITGDRAVVEWVVRAPKGTQLALTARADRAGVVRTVVSLD
jgi:hypothetical protein